MATKNDTVSKSWFAVFNNPEVHGYSGTPQEICNRLRDEWIDGSDTRSGAWAYCISAEGLHHVHMVLEDTISMRFSVIKKNYACGMHFDPTKGTKKQAEDYINKRGGFEEKGESIEFICTYGDIQGRQGSRSDLRNIVERITLGETPSDILADTPTAYLKRDVLKAIYLDKRLKETPRVRDVKVYWHFGSSGSGKSRYCSDLCEKYGEDNVFTVTTYGTGMFDKYMGQKIVIFDDFRGDSIDFTYLLRLLDVYKCELQCRFSNSFALWSEVHITSPLTPRECYPRNDMRSYDSIEQLLRRITSLVYHVKGEDGRFYSYGFDSHATRYDVESDMEDILKVQNQWVADFGNLSEFEEILSYDDSIGDEHE